MLGWRGAAEHRPVDSTFEMRDQAGAARMWAYQMGPAEHETTGIVVSEDVAVVGVGRSGVDTSCYSKVGSPPNTAGVADPDDAPADTSIHFLLHLSLNA